MKSITGRIAPRQTQIIYGIQPDQPYFDQHSLLWQNSLPGVKGTAALRALLIQASAKFGEEDFPYQRTAQALYFHQSVIFSGGTQLPAGRRPTARRWGQAVWLDLQIRAQLSLGTNIAFHSNESLYQEYLHFAGLIGLKAVRLPANFGAFSGWAQASFAGWEAENYHQLALCCIEELLPLSWPVNIALILYLLPMEFLGVYRRSLGKGSARLASRVGQVLTDLSSTGS
ncbi:MAG: hypothetical protein ABFS17_11600 [Chloroflexota bacterium]